jgi:hypothetical protein
VASAAQKEKEIVGQKEFVFTPVKPAPQWSRIGLRFLIGSIVAAVLFAILDGLIKGPFESGAIPVALPSNRAILITLATWIVSFQNLAVQAVYASTIFFVGAKFFETRQLFTIGFDHMDAGKLELKGPDRENIVWIGYKCANRKEAEAIAAAYEARLKAGVES